MNRGPQDSQQHFTPDVGCGCLSLKRCAMRNPGDVLGASGAGAHHLQVVPKRVSSRPA
jgi:MerR family redox-sensitive transcriptional activator SoxR